MIFRFPALARVLPMVSAVAVALSADAQGMKPGQRIVFSAPDNGAASNAAPATPSLAPSSPDMSPFADVSPSPPPSFVFTPATPASRRMPSLSPAQATELRRSQDRQKNWALMTPAEIMGVPTAEKIFGVESNAGESVVERYYERTHREDMQMHYTNNASADWNLFGRPPSDLNPGEAGSLSAPVFRPAFDNAPAPKPSTRPAAPFGWPNPFNSVATPPPTPAQQASTAEFQRLLNPHSSSPPRPTPSVFSASTPADLFAPSPGKMGGSPSAPMNPVAKPLPGAVMPQDATSPVPDWKPQLPPWMMSTPPAGTVPQRKF